MSRVSFIACAAVLAGSGLFVVSAQVPSTGVKPPAADAAAKSPPAKPAATPAETGLSDPVERIDNILDRRGPFDFSGQLSELAAHLRERYQIPVVMNGKSIRSAGLKDDVRLSLSRKDIALRTALGELLCEHELGFGINDEALTLSSREVSESHMYLRVYPVGDVVQRLTGTIPIQVGAEAPHDCHADDLVVLIQTNVTPSKWDIAGGPGAVRIGRGLMVVSATTATHAGVREALASLREMARITREGAAHPTSFCLGHPADEKLRDTLRRPAEISAEGQPLAEALAGLAKRYHFPIERDKAKIKEYGHDLSKIAVTLNLKEVSLRSLFSHLLKPSELGIEVRNGTIVVTTLEEVKSHLSVRYYPVRDLAGPPGMPDDELDYDSIIELITTTVAPPTWEASGGPGPVRAFRSFGVLVIAQTDDVHAEIEQLLTSLRRARQETGFPADRRREEENGYILKVYYVRTATNQKPEAKELPSAKELAELVRELIAPESWNGETKTFIRPVSHTIVIRQRPSIHKQIRELLNALAVVDVETLNIGSHDDAEKNGRPVAA